MRPAASNAARAVWQLWPALLLPFDLAGCAGLQKALGIRTHLEGLKVESLHLKLSRAAIGSDLCVGEEVPLVAGATLEDGELLVTEGAGSGKIAWDAFTVTMVGGNTRHVSRYFRSDEMLVAIDPRESFHDPVSIRIVARHHPDLSRELQLEARYDCEFEGDFRGAPGADGSSGWSGSDGDDGEGDEAGEDGGDGSDGGDGKDAGNGDRVRVRIALASHHVTGQPLLQVEAVGERRGALYFALDPDHGQLLLDASGGRGGDGGDGGDGGVGGLGGLASSGSDGDGGCGGLGGNGGDGGSFDVRVDSDARERIGRVRFVNSAGMMGTSGSDGDGGSPPCFYSRGKWSQAGGSGPAPEIVFEPMEPL